MLRSVHQESGDEGMAGRIHVRGGVLAVARGRFWAGASLAALVVAGVTPRQAMAGNYVANSDGSLRAAINAANADLDPNATITLTASFTVSTLTLPTSTKPLTIDTQGFTLFGAPNSGMVISGAGAERTLSGTFMGSDGGSAATGVAIRNGAAVINMGLVQGGTGASGSGGPGIDFGGPGAATALTNHGTIRGGAGTSGNGGVGIFVRNGAGQIINTGTIEGGGPGARAIADNNAVGSIDVVNSGTIRAGAGADAIGWTGITPTTGVIRLELQDGSQIFGNVGANATATTDRLRLSGTGFSILDGSIGDAGQYRNFDIFEKTGSGTWALTADNTATTNWDIQQGTLQLGNDGTSGSIIGDVANAGTLAFDRSDAPTYGGTISGTGSVSQIGSGTTILTGANTYTGGTTVNAGKLVVEGSLGNTETTVNSGGTLGGSGSIGGAVIVADGGVLAPGSSPGTLTVGSLSLSSGSILDYELGQAGIVGGGVNDLIEVTGALTLDGSLNITDVGGFGPGVYRLINYGGALTDHGLELGNLPAGVTAADLTVQTSVDKQVNLISSVGTDLWFWDGDAAGNANNNLVDGGNGTWTATGPNWTTSTGLVNGAMKPQPGFAVFQTLGGTVVADDSAGALEVTGMQFAADGYRIEGDPVTLAGAGGESIIRVGDGTVAGAGYTATIASVLTGASSLTKTDAGTLVLSGANTYTGGTTVLGGVLSVAADNNLGDAAGALTLSGGTLRNTAAFGSARGVILSAAGGTFDTVADLTLSGAISGAGSLAKTGAGTLTLTGTNSYGGNTLVGAGTLVGNAASIRGDIGNSGIVVFDQARTPALPAISPAPARW